MVALDVLVVVLLIVLNGFFAMAELAVISSRKQRLAALAQAGSAGARTALRLVEQPARFLSSVQIGITLIGVLAGAFSGATLADPLAAWFEGLGLGEGVADTASVALVVAAVTYLSLIVGELVPKQVALRDPERVATAVARPMALLARAASPLVWLLEVSTRGVLGLLGLREGPGQRVTAEEIRVLVAEAESAGVVEPAERRMVTAVMRLGNRSVRGLMTPRHEVDWLDLEADRASLLARLRASPHARLPVARGSVDEVAGVVAARDVLAAALDGEGPIDLAALARPPTVVPDGTDALDALEALRKAPLDMALVVDEYGTFEGIVTAADLLQAIAGGAPAAADAAGGEAEPYALRREDGSWLLDGLMPVEDMADTLRLPVPARRDYHTVAGFVLDRLRRLPRLGDAFEAGEWRLEVIDMDGRRIDKVLACPARARPAGYRA